MATETNHPPPGNRRPRSEMRATRWSGRSRPFARGLRASRTRTPSFADVHTALRRLEQHEDPEGMFLAASEEAVHACDLNGVAVCGLHGQTLVLESAFVAGRPDLAEVAVALAGDPSHIDPSLQSELTRRPSPVVVGNARSDPLVPPRVAELLSADVILIAPIATGTEAVGLLYGVSADGTFDWADRELTWTLAAGLAQLVVTERLRRQLGLQDTALRRLTVSARSPQPARAPEPAALARLTAREREVLALMTQGCTNDEIAARLVVAPGTIKSHVRSVLRKLGVANRTEAVARFGRHADEISAPGAR